MTHCISDGADSGVRSINTSQVGSLVDGCMRGTIHGNVGFVGVVVPEGQVGELRATSRAITKGSRGQGKSDVDGWREGGCISVIV